MSFAMKIMAMLWIAMGLYFAIEKSPENSLFAIAVCAWLIADRIVQAIKGSKP